MLEKNITFETAREFFNYFIESDFWETEHIFDVSDKITCSYIFRGQAQSTWDLLPAVHRSTDALNNFTPQPPSSDHFRSNVEHWITVHVHAELRSVLLFLEAADHVGIPTPIDYSHFTQIVSDSDRMFEPRLLPSIALAQHHGVPTRLLDWTESPFIAAFFAANSALKHDVNSKLSVTCISTHLLKKAHNISLISLPKASNKFLCAQRGLFTLVNNANEFYKTHNKWPSLEDILEEVENPQDLVRPGIVRVSLPVSEAKPLLKLLYKLDISELTIMPSLHNAAKHFRNKKLIWDKE